MLVTEIMVVSDPNYTVRIGNENYFSLAVAGLIGVVFLFTFIAFKFGSSFGFKKHSQTLSKVNQYDLRKPQIIVTAK